MSGEIVECPADECDYSGPPASVGGHWQAKTDGVHPGGRQRCMELLSSSGGEASPSDSSPEQSPGSSPDASDSIERREPGSEQAEASNPVMGHAKPEKPPQAGSEASQNTSREQASRQGQNTPSMEPGEDEPVCRRCGGELYDFRQFDNGRYHQVNGASVFVAGDFQCSSCGKWWMQE